MVILIFFILFLNVFLYTFDRVITPSMLDIAESQIRAKITDVINKAIINEYTKNFHYDDIINIEKDVNGDITLLKADTLKMNKIACDVSLESQSELKKLEHMGISFPMGYVFKNNLLAYYGPNVKVKIRHLGYIETKYFSNFNSAGINQTRHTISVQVKSKVRIILPLKTKEIEVKNQVPICETIIVGNTPNTAIDMKLEGAGFKLNSKN
ncbi:sporulation protein YunB [Clostridium sp. L74]|uniref:sporulation protein YunB n=1 Tax=Clostridium sp. L74 TaxID=1560217 RepID=UPI00241CAC25|nr:sporulation protein YunB [Clostridium sp. L74]